MFLKLVHFNSLFINSSLTNESPPKPNKPHKYSSSFFLFPKSLKRIFVTIPFASLSILLLIVSEYQQHAWGVAILTHSPMTKKNIGWLRRSDGETGRFTICYWFKFFFFSCARSLRLARRELAVGKKFVNKRAPKESLNHHPWASLVRDQKVPNLTVVECKFHRLLIRDAMAQQCSTLKGFIDPRCAYAANGWNFSSHRWPRWLLQHMQSTSPRFHYAEKNAKRGKNANATVCTNDSFTR